MDLTTLIIILCFVLAVILIITIVAFRNATPSTINHGTIHNHYYGKEEIGTGKIVEDDTVLLLAEAVGTLIREVRRQPDPVP